MEELKKLVKVLGYTTSPNDNESLTACRMANGIMASMNMTWEQLISEKTIVIHEIAGYAADAKQAPKDAKDIEAMLKTCLSNVTSSSGRKFIQSLADWYLKKGFLTTKQKEALQRWYDNV